MEFFDFKCKKCGGEPLDKVAGSRFVGKCRYCGTEQTVHRPSVGDVNKLFEDAERFRRNNEFDKADALYEQILTKVTDDPEVYWLRMLCRFGIEYVEDPDSHERKPTVHRMRYESVFSDENYRSAIKHADDEQRDIYEQEAHEVDKILQQYMKISHDVHYQVFICYKETDEQGRRTDDSKYAQGLYNALTKKGIDVFFSRVTLQSVAGTAYEPYIFAALNSANVMVVLGSKSEYFDSVWLKNEWSRYLSLVNESGGKKVLIPALRNMDAYDLPKELLHLQAKDVSSPRAMNDLVYAIEKLLSGVESVEAVLERGYAFLSCSHWQDAQECFDQVLTREPQNAEAYLGLLMNEHNARERAQLANCRVAFDKSKNFQAIQNYGSYELKQELDGYLLTCAYNFLKYSDWRSARSCFKGVLDRQPDSAEARLGLLLEEYRLCDKSQLATCREPFERNEHYVWLQAFGSDMLKRELDEYMLKRAYGFLRDSNWRRAENCFDILLERKPEEAHLGLLLVENRIYDKAQLSACKKPFEDSEHFRWLQTYGAQGLRYELDAYLSTIKAKRKKKKVKRIIITVVAVFLVIDIGAAAIALTTSNGGFDEFFDELFDKITSSKEPSSIKDTETSRSQKDATDAGEESVKHGTFKEGKFTCTEVDGGVMITEVDRSIIGDVTIPSKLGGQPVVSIGDEAFAYCQSLTGLVIPEGVTSIGDGAFYECNYLMNISIPNSIESIGYDTFFDCEGLTYGGTVYNNGWYLGNSKNPYLVLIEYNWEALSCDLHADTKIIYDWAFQGCEELSYIYVPNGVKSIGYGVFANCYSLREINIPKTVTSIDFAFENCNSLASIMYGGTKAQWNAVVGNSDWYVDSYGYTVYCTNGNIEKNLGMETY